jgi:hypothetical protein
LRFLRYFHRGLGFLPHEGVEVLHQGEVLLPEHQHDFPGVATLGRARDVGAGLGDFTAAFELLPLVDVDSEIVGFLEAQELSVDGALGKHAHVQPDVDRDHDAGAFAVAEALATLVVADALWVAWEPAIVQ